ncbi:hypothetical protein D3C83_08580 [compost metagenome]
MPTSRTENPSGWCVRWMSVLFQAKRSEFTVVLLRTRVSPSASECARLSRPPLVAVRMLAVRLCGGGTNMVVRM